VNSRNLTATPVRVRDADAGGYDANLRRDRGRHQQATFDAMNQFMGVMLDPTVGALSGTSVHPGQ